MSKKKGYIAFSQREDRYMHYADDGSDTELHCGDVMTIFYHGCYRAARLEMDVNHYWYLQIGPERIYEPSRITAYI